MDWVKRVNADSQEVVGTTSHDHKGKVAESSDGDFTLSTNGDGRSFLIETKSSQISPIKSLSTSN